VHSRLATLTIEPHSAAGPCFALDRHATVTQRRQITQQRSAADAEFGCELTDSCRVAAAQHVTQLENALGPRHW
jgi:hypothetical protein